jgi:hypothetical protein
MRDTCRSTARAARIATLEEVLALPRRTDSLGWPVITAVEIEALLAASPPEHGHIAPPAPTPKPKGSRNPWHRE